MSLEQMIEELSTRAQKEMPGEIQDLLQRGIERLQQEGLAGRATKIGDLVQDFSLPNARGDAVSLSAILQQGPAILSFYRGSWCPYCNLELRALRDALPDLAALGASVLAISPQLPDQSLSDQELDQLGFEVLSDTGNRVAGQFGLVYELDEELRPVYKAWNVDLPALNGDASFELPIPSTFVIDVDGKVVGAFNDVDYRHRMEPDAIVAILRRLSK